MNWKELYQQRMAEREVRKHNVFYIMYAPQFMDSEEWYSARMYIEDHTAGKMAFHEWLRREQEKNHGA